MKKIILISLTFIFVVALIIGGLFLSYGIYPVVIGIHDTISQADGIAIGGFDPVSYFEGTATKGSSKFRMEYEGATWHFATAKHLSMFNSDQEKYSPALGGHCALAMTTGFAVESNPESWVIMDDKLYLFSGDEVKEKFMADSSASVAACNSYWMH